MQTNECNVTYELVKPEDLNPKERAQDIFVSFLEKIPEYYLHDNRTAHATAIEHAIDSVKLILRLPLIGSGRMQPESFEDLKYWKEVLNELEKM